MERKSSLFLHPDQFPVGTYRMGVLSLDAAFNAIPNIPEGALVVVVRQNNPYNPVWITHLGFVVRHSDTDVRIRHATKMGGGVVKEHHLKWYFEHIRIYLSPMEGVLVLMPQELEETHTVVIFIDRMQHSYSDISHSAPMRTQSSEAPQAPVGTLKIDGPQPFAIQ